MANVKAKTDRQNLPSTHWSVIFKARTKDPAKRLAALETVCRTYWLPLYCFARRRGSRPEDAEDLTQTFFASFLEKNSMSQADPERGRFRTFLLTSFKNFLSNEWKRVHSVRRGGGLRFVSWDTQFAENHYACDGVTSETPDKVFDRTWAIAILQQAMARVRSHYAAAGKAPLFELLKLRLWNEPAGVSYAELAAQLDLSEAAVKMAILRLRRRFRNALRQEVERTVNDPEEVEEELQYLLSVLRS